MCISNVLFDGQTLLNFENGNICGMRDSDNKIGEAYEFFLSANKIKDRQANVKMYILG